ncbi:hypothetical protein, partial [Enterococcus faecium]|uniref:hypothetical protein n=1 Tax=Enterococcus faecium TaxID=1352 RepID=UPI0034E987A4
ETESLRTYGYKNYSQDFIDRYNLTEYIENLGRVKAINDKMDKFSGYQDMIKSYYRDTPEYNRVMKLIYEHIVLPDL